MALHLAEQLPTPRDAEGIGHDDAVQAGGHDLAAPADLPEYFQWVSVRADNARMKRFEFVAVLKDRVGPVRDDSELIALIDSYELVSEEGRVSYREVPRHPVRGKRTAERKDGRPG